MFSKNQTSKNQNSLYGHTFISQTIITYSNTRISHSPLCVGEANMAGGSIYNETHLPLLTVCHHHLKILRKLYETCKETNQEKYSISANCPNSNNVTSLSPHKYSLTEHKTRKICGCSHLRYLDRGHFTFCVLINQPQ